MLPKSFTKRKDLRMDLNVDFKCVFRLSLAGVSDGGDLIFLVTAVTWESSEKLSEDLSVQVMKSKMCLGPFKA